MKIGKEKFKLSAEQEKMIEDVIDAIEKHLNAQYYSSFSHLYGWIANEVGLKKDEDKLLINHAIAKLMKLNKITILHPYNDITSIGFMKNPNYKWEDKNFFRRVLLIPLITGLVGIFMGILIDRIVHLKIEDKENISQCQTDSR